MRELNPRAWIPSLNRYATGDDAIYYHCQINHENGEWWCYPAGEIIQLDVEIELPTGIKDKNGKEIYEGDIVKCGPYCGRPIVFEEGRYWLGEEPDDLFTSSVHWDIEIIGNIHENSELLEDKK